ncbi:TIGR03086 family metal-binding protein [Streptomyces sp. NPDC026673]|uniref:TIGR03086 family metal-binding protein n=1 Tax=Streptomyces sp. NPDC026673 TaxID=3155724 RepID=UPI0033CFAE10
MTRHPDLRPAARDVRGLLERVADRQLDAPTPCPDYTVAQLIGHIAGFCAGFRDAARKDFGPTTDSDPGAFVPEPPADWRDLLPVLLGEMSDAWCGAQAWEGETVAGGVTLPAAAAGRFALNELLVHGWDLARATGQDYGPAEPGLRAAITLLSDVRAASGDAADGSGPFGRPVPVPAAAPPLDRLLGLTGRDPAWSPPR